MQAFEAKRVGVVLKLFPYLSQQCIQTMLIRSKSCDPLATVLKSWRLFHGERSDASTRVSCCTLVSSVVALLDFANGLQRDGDGYFKFGSETAAHDFVEALRKDGNGYLRIERAAVALWSVYTHLNGMVIPLKLADICMSGPNQESFYAKSCKSRMLTQIARRFATILQNDL